MSQLRVQDKGPDIKTFRLEVDFNAKSTSFVAQRTFTILAMTTRLFIASVIFASSLFSQNPAKHPGTPFKGTMEGLETVTRTEDPFVFFVLTGRGNATHLGSFTLYAPHVADLAAAVGMGKFELTAANGDTVTATFTGAATPIPNSQEVTIVEYAVITGGTGRFAGATGTFRLERVFSFITSLTKGSFDGVIILTK